MSENFLTRIEALEAHIAFQEDTIESLNHAIIQLQLDIQRQHEQIKILAQKLATVQASTIALPSEETPPPHY